MVVVVVVVLWLIEYTACFVQCHGLDYFIPTKSAAFPIYHVKIATKSMTKTTKTIHLKAIVNMCK